MHNYISGGSVSHINGVWPVFILNSYVHSFVHLRCKVRNPQSNPKSVFFIARTRVTAPKMANLVNLAQEMSQKFDKLEKEVCALRKQADKSHAHSCRIAHRCSQSRTTHHRSQDRTTHHHHSQSGSTHRPPSRMTHHRSRSRTTHHHSWSRTTIQWSQNIYCHHAYHKRRIHLCFGN